MKILKICLFIFIVIILSISCTFEAQIQSKPIISTQHQDVDIIGVKLINGKEDVYSELEYNDFYMSYEVNDGGLSIYKEAREEIAFYPKGTYEKVFKVTNRVPTNPVEKDN